MKFNSDSLSEYLAKPAINSSLLREVALKSEAHARFMLDHPKKSRAFAIGAAIHCAVLEPENFDRLFAVRPAGIDGRTRDGKAALARFYEAAATKTIVPDANAYEMLQGAIKSCYGNDLACELLSSPNGKSEVSCYSDNRVTGLQCKARPDRITPHPDTGQMVRVDVKTMQVVDAHHVRQAVQRFRYDIQASHWPDDADAQPFFVIAIEKSPPFSATVYELRADWLEVGRIARDDALARWHAAKKTNIYPGIPNQELECPVYLLPSLEGFDDAA